MWKLPRYEILIRDFDRERFEWRKNTIENGVREFSKRFGLKIELELKDQYSNMRERSNRFTTLSILQSKPCRS